MPECDLPGCLLCSGDTLVDHEEDNEEPEPEVETFDGCGCEVEDKTECQNYGDQCTDCCGCEVCTYCDAHVGYYSDLCGTCDRCDDCCECCYCESCDSKVWSEDWDYDSEVCSNCNNRWGDTVLPNWEVRGVVVEYEKASTPWLEDLNTPAYLEEWKIDTTIDLCRAFADFYLLTFIAQNVRLLRQKRPDPGIQALVSEAREMLTALVTKLDQSFMGYLDMAIGGELRYHRAVKVKPKFNERSQAWMTWKTVRETVGPQALLDAAEMFREVEGTGYMGDPWAKIAEVLHMRVTGRIDSFTFVDRAFSLQHNGGIAFNKLEWNNMENQMQWRFDMIQFLLGPAQHHNPTFWPPLLMAARPEVVSLFNEYWLESNNLRRMYGEAIEKLPRAYDNLVINPNYGSEIVAHYDHDSTTGQPRQRFYIRNPELLFFYRSVLKSNKKKEKEKKDELVIILGEAAAGIVEDVLNGEIEFDPDTMFKTTLSHYDIKNKVWENCTCGPCVQALNALAQGKVLVPGYPS